MATRPRARVSTALTRLRPARVAAAGLVLAALTACTSPDSPGTDEPTEPATSNTGSPTESSDPTPDVEAAEVRATLGAIDPCSLLAGPDGASARYAEGSHTCEGQLDGVRVRVEVGVPFDEAARSAADREEVAGLAAFSDADRCRLVFVVGASHGVAVRPDAGCDDLLAAAEVVGTALAGDVDGGLREPGPDSLTACGLLSGGVDDAASLLDAAGSTSQGLDHCEVATGAVLARTGLSLGYTGVPFEEMARLLKGRRASVAGGDAVLKEGQSGCFLHTYLGETHADGRGAVRTEAIVRAATCAEARDVGVAVVESAGERPATPGSVSDLLGLGS